MEDWQRMAVELAAELVERGEVRVEADGEEYRFNINDLAALGVAVFVAGPERTAEVVCSWIGRARVPRARAMGDA